MTTTQHLIQEQAELLADIGSLESRNADDAAFTPLYDRLYEVDRLLAAAPLPTTRTVAAVETARDSMDDDDYAAALNAAKVAR